jgi:hypothetical protein
LKLGEHFLRLVAKSRPDVGLHRFHVKGKSVFGWGWLVRRYNKTLVGPVRATVHNTNCLVWVHFADPDDDFEEGDTSQHNATPAF